MHKNNGLCLFERSEGSGPWDGGVVGGDDGSEVCAERVVGVQKGLSVEVGHETGARVCVSVLVC